MFIQVDNGNKSQNEKLDEKKKIQIGNCIREAQKLNLQNAANLCEMGARISKSEASIQ